MCCKKEWDNNMLRIIMNKTKTSETKVQISER